MTKTKHKQLGIALSLLLLLLCIVMYIYMIFNANYGYSQDISSEEHQRRQQLISQAQLWLGTTEGSDAHVQLLEIYNSHEPLAQGYPVQTEDNWCATFVSVAAIESGLTDIIPTECGCQRQIGLFDQIGCWVEADDYVPQPGDIIYYCGSDNTLSGDCAGWSDHVGIVVGTWGGFIKTIEGNYGDEVAYRYIPINAPTIRGFAVPEY